MRKTHRRNLPGSIPYCHVVRPRCQHCGSTELRIYKSSKDQGDESSLQYAECRLCWESTKIVWDREE